MNRIQELRKRRAFSEEENKFLIGLASKDVEDWKATAQRLLSDKDEYAVESTACVFINSKYEEVKKNRAVVSRWREVQLILLVFVVFSLASTGEFSTVQLTLATLCLFLSKVCLVQSQYIGAMSFSRSSEVAVHMIQRTVQRAILRKVLNEECESAIQDYVNKIVENTSETMDLSIREALLKQEMGLKYDIAKASQSILVDIYARDRDKTRYLLRAVREARAGFIEGSKLKEASLD